MAQCICRHDDPDIRGHMPGCPWPQAEVASRGDDTLDALAYMTAAFKPCQHRWTLWVTDSHPDPHYKCLDCGKLR